MVRIEGEIVINRPVEDVFDFVADERNEPRYNPQMRRAEQISDGPIGIGSAAKNGPGPTTIPSALWLVVMVAGTLLAVGVLTAIPGRIGARRPVTQVLQAETT